MDDIVRAAMAKWPHVPDCYGWLGLDARGDWYMRDDAVQAAGPFPASRGSRLEHDKLKEFIGRNYGADARGCWYFQNGPQRVYVELEVTPWVWRLLTPNQVMTHTGMSAAVQYAMIDELGRGYLMTDMGFGIVASRDMAVFVDGWEQGQWLQQEGLSFDLPSRFGYVRSPRTKS